MENTDPLGVKQLRDKLVAIAKKHAWRSEEGTFHWTIEGVILAMLDARKGMLEELKEPVHEQRKT